MKQVSKNLRIFAAIAAMGLIPGCNDESSFKAQNAMKKTQNQPSTSDNSTPESPGMIVEGLDGDCPVVTNLLQNPDFEAGKSGFSSDFTFDSQCIGTYSPKKHLYYSVNDSVQRCHNGYASLSGDKGKMLVVNFPPQGSSITKFYCQTVPVTAGRLYKIAARLRAAVPSSVLSQPTSVAFTANGSNVMAEFKLEADWKDYRAVLTPPVSGSVVFCGEARTQNVESTDLVMDDVLFGECKTSNP
jgi:hypothetical protein